MHDDRPDPSPLTRAEIDTAVEADARESALRFKERRRAEIKAQRALRSPDSPATRLRALQVNESTLLTQYHSAAQVGSTMERLRYGEGLHFTARRERDPATGAVIGVRVTRVK